MDLAKNLIQLSSNSSNTKEEDYLINQINEYIKLYERIEERGIELNNQINSYHEKIQQKALKSLYADMIDQTVCEEEKNSKLNSIIKNGTIVAAKQPVTKSAEQNWILATVVGYKPEVKAYEVEDADQFEASNRLFTVPNKHVLPIANRGEIKINEFPKDHPVLALYTETTCFYKAVVVLPPSKITPSKKDCYLLEFEDDGHAHRYVESQYVLDIPKEVMDLKSNNTT
ncbi:6348_t:CDS:2 [Entrophospora sp. SA101]|nr:682_t:CDS:2 [Entrophospora sp. SA101]CAJ0887504.1 6348_t:CDS:2 [Entrophospora sp. SA101]